MRACLYQMSTLSSLLCESYWNWAAGQLTFEISGTSFLRCFTLSPAGVGSSDGGVVRFRFKWGFHGLPPDFRSPPCIYQKLAHISTCMLAVFTCKPHEKRGGSLGGLWGSVSRTEKRGHALFSSPSARHFSPRPFVVVFCHHVAVYQGARTGAGKLRPVELFDPAR